jgi:uncharacterized OB-fold protein
MGYEGPLPRPDNDSAIYWEGARRHELLLQWCTSCKRPRFYPRSVCPFCFSDVFSWEKASGGAVIYTFTVVHRPPYPAFRDKVPYVLALVQLEEGVRMMTNVIDCDLKEVHIGMKVEVAFDDVTDEITLPKFRPSRRTEAK